MKMKIWKLKLSCEMTPDTTLNGNPSQVSFDFRRVVFDK